MASAVQRLDRVVKAYDVRGTDEDLDPEVARALGVGIAEELGAPGPQGEVLLGHDMRPSSPVVVEALTAGITSRGVDVRHLGLVSTDALSFAAGHLHRAGAMVTASHNPAGHNGIKLCRAGAVPVAIDTGLARVRDVARRVLVDGTPPPVDPPGAVHHDRIDDAFVAHVHRMIDTSVLRDVRIAVDAGNGMAGRVVPLVFADLPVEVDELYFELDGSFPNHPANPLDPANLADLARHVVDHDLPLGLAFDGDADRVFAVDETGRPVSSSLVGAVVAERLLARNPGATVLYNLICSRTVPEVIEAAGGVPVRTRVGHSFIKARMAETDAVFAVEHSGHYYFRDFYRADSGLVAALVLLEAVAEQDRPLSEVVAPHDRRVASGERDLVVDDPAETVERVASALADDAAAVDRLDGLTVDVGAAWANLRPSNTEPVLRLNVEGDDRAAMQDLLDRVTAIVADPHHA
ncbi:phosphomannomutase/phosphoglucomutase [Salsipaludibacter albus]|uniref:phosphomannomutase/phosphoglucomutase n=1 Tax=Salsipaludibacter albus TaxID=2849650 RepID=UPI001EE3FDB2|nr:phosphomannomutase/phosphoglucomutase [Salsipaludibacter albus]